MVKKVFRLIRVLTTMYRVGRWYVQYSGKLFLVAALPVLQVRVEYMPVLRHLLTNPMVKGEEGGEKHVVELLSTYCLGK